MGIFEGTAGFYTQFRPPYPAVLWSTLASELRLDGTGRLLDLGTGPGIAARALAGYAGSVVAVDPEPEMLAEARASGGPGIEWVLDTAETFAAPPGSLRAVTMGQSFHWMQRPLVLERLFDMLEPGGGIAVFGGGSPAVEMFSSPLGQAIAEVQARWLGEPMGRRPGVDGGTTHQAAIAASSFGAPRELELPWRQEWTIERFVGFLQSTSWRPQETLGGRFTDFTDELASALSALEPSGAWVLEGSIELLLAHKPQ